MSQYFDKPLCNLHIVEYAKVSEGGISYEKASHGQSCRRSDGVVAFGTRDIGKISHILHVEQQEMVHVVLVVQPFVVEPCNIAIDTETGRGVDHIFVVSEEPLLPPLILPVSSGLTKCVQITVQGTKYCCIIPNMVELD